MTIKEVEEILGIPMASIRFYEKEQLIVPKRGTNGYRDYDARDVATYKKVVMFRELGLRSQRSRSCWTVQSRSRMRSMTTWSGSKSSSPN